jgi:hypothetical protein
MAPKKRPTPEDRLDAVVVVLTGLASGQDFDSIIQKLGDLHVPHDTFPAEELLELASDAIAESGSTAADPIEFEKIREQYLPEHKFSGKNPHYKSKYALLIRPGIRGGSRPWKRGWSHVRGSTTQEADRSALLTRGEGPGRSARASAPS